ncbi:hypothetical protein CL6EHI_042840 [Entamoeba histolytica]|uniref:Uncharacterized protein n=2 Tax=Entamoeba histolytica TaxID=5759 RepID=B1N3X1_ENTH1|nr:hypothetical protein EHI_042840 [Entamoeba histolytica HM-1:IMSS]EDS89336.1 hypothetical protein EHI_042840 [Entamoeba histolytica HM-1:IMSS]GAT96936.1 hypothetical protein CL6EHI_042840 [Entamoeba histolytica]|eukprot:XP_001913887.1 hypothetical protein EHI_042840 [Entamoeba histolytica HM-1:IMSS]
MFFFIILTVINVEGRYLYDIIDAQDNVLNSRNEEKSYKYFKYVSNEYQTEYYPLNSCIGFTDYAAYFFYNNNTHMNFTSYATMENCKNAINPIENRTLQINYSTVDEIRDSYFLIYLYYDQGCKNLQYILNKKKFCFPLNGRWWNFTIVKNTIQGREYSDSSCLDLVSNFTTDLNVCLTYPQNVFYIDPSKNELPGLNLDYDYNYNHVENKAQIILGYLTIMLCIFSLI